MRSLGIAVALVIALFSSRAAAAQSGDEDESARLFESIEWIAGPDVGRLGNEAEVQIPESCRFTESDGARAFMLATQNPPSGNERGILLCENPDDPEDHYFVVFTYDPSGYVKDDEGKTLDAAKILATIDVLSGGRLTLGIGAGWLREEFEALGVPDFAARGKVTDEYLLAFKELWTSESPSFTGEHVRFGDLTFEPKPVQKPYPPIWVGGESGPALRRAARLGDGWYPIGTNPSHPLDSLARYQAGIARLRKLTAEAGRDPRDVALAYRCQRHGVEVPARAGDGERRLFSGGPAEIAGDLRDLRALGVGSMDFSFGGDTVDAVLTSMKWFRDEVLARV